MRFRRTMTVIVGVFFLVFGWRTVTLALHSLQNHPDSVSSRQEERFADVIPAYSDQKENDISDTAEEIILVNKDHPLEDTYQPDLVKLRDYGVEVDREIYDSLLSMLQDGEKEGLKFWVASGYRSMERQRELLDEDIEALMKKGSSPSEAYEEVVRETMPVGCSEHATGLAVDIVAKDYQILDEKQARTEEIEWLQDHCSRYGFILRYPEDKEDITKVSYESWHFRYVGVTAAKEIMEKGITLEEYLDRIDYSVE